MFKVGEVYAVVIVKFIVLYRLSCAAVPNITVGLEDRRVLVGEDANFTCDAVAEPQPTTQWYYESMLLNSSNKYGIGGELGSGLSGESVTSLPSGILMVYNASLEDTGVYQCVVVNIHGNDSSKAQLYVQGLFVSPQALPCLSLTGVSTLQLHL